MKVLWVIRFRCFVFESIIGLGLYSKILLSWSKNLNISVIFLWVFPCCSGWFLDIAQLFTNAHCLFCASAAGDRNKGAIYFTYWVFITSLIYFLIHVWWMKHYCLGSILTRTRIPIGYYLSRMWSSIPTPNKFIIIIVFNLICCQSYCMEPSIIMVQLLSY